MGLVMLPVLVSKHLHVFGYNVRVLIKGYTDEVAHACSDLGRERKFIGPEPGRATRPGLFLMGKGFSRIWRAPEKF